MPTMFSRCDDAVSKEKRYLSIGAAVFIEDDDCVEAMHCFDDCAFLGYQGK